MGGGVGGRGGRFASASSVSLLLDPSDVDEP